MTTAFSSKFRPAPFFDVSHYPHLEMRAMNECRGSVLDIGSAAGRHSLELVRRGLKVTSLNILPEMKPIMEERGLTDVVIADIFQFYGRRYDTLLMLMNGIGMSGSIQTLERFLQRAHDLVLPGGQILCDSMDVNVTCQPQHVACREKNLASGQPPGQQTFVMDYAGEESVRFDWLHSAFGSLSRTCGLTRWDAELLESEDDGHYLCRLTQNSTKLAMRQAW